MNVGATLRSPLARVSSALAATLVLAGTLGFPGCPESTFKPGVSSNPNAIAMANLWPNDDGRWWTYAVESRGLAAESWTPVPAGQTPREVTVADVPRLFEDPVSYDGSLRQYGYHFQFDGMLTTESGVTAQNLTEGFTFPRDANAAAPAAGFPAALLARIAAARPDLRARLAARGVRPAAWDPLIYAPEFIHGYAWRKASTWIGTYGDLDTLPAWKFLEYNLREGRSFSVQLVPELADDIWLRAMVGDHVAATLPGGEVVTGLRMYYLIDYGVSAQTDPYGQVLGTARWFDYGQVVYVPAVGPVMDVERRMAIATDRLTHGWANVRFTLAETGVAVPVAAR